MARRVAISPAEQARRDAAAPLGARKPSAPKITFYDDIEQNSEEWLALRAGMQTASNFSAIMAEGRSQDADSKMRTKLLYRLAAERVMGEPAAESYRNRAMDRGKEMEPLALDEYARDSFADLRRVGFVTREVGSGIDRFTVGCSPDALLDPDGAVEIKTEQPDLLVERLIRGVHHFPPEHRAQVQGVMWICDRQWCDLKIFWPKMPRFVVRFYRDDKFIREIENACERFEFELNQLVTRLRRMG